MAANGTLSGTPLSSDIGTNVFSVAATDSGGLSSLATLLIKVNGAPTFSANSFAASDANAGQAYSVSITNQATDPNPGDTLSFVKLSGPSWLRVGPNGALSGTPLNADVGTNAFSISVTDAGGLSSTALVSVNVNGAPTFSASSLVAANANAGRLYSASITNQATDPNHGDTLSFAKLSGPSWLTVGPNGALSGTPLTTDAGTNVFSLSVTDLGGLSASAILYVAVKAAPAFVANPFTMPVATVAQPYSGVITNQVLAPSLADNLTFAKLSGPSWLIVTADGALAGTPLDADVGTNSFIVAVTDSDGLTGSAVMDVSVGQTVAAISLQIGIENNLLALSWTGGKPPFQLQVSTNLAHVVWENRGGLITNYTLSVVPSDPVAAYRIQGSQL